MTDFAAVDPGARSGISLCRFTDDTPLELLNSWDVSGGVFGFIDWYVENEPAGLAFLVCEDFINRNVKGADVNSSNRVIGALSVLSHELDIPLHMQPPAGRIMAVPDEKVKMVPGMVKSKAGRNTFESTRHALLYMKKMKHRPTLLHYWGGPSDTTL